MSDLWTFDPNTQEWESLEADGETPSLRVGAAFVHTGRHVILAGGSCGSSCGINPGGKLPFLEGKTAGHAVVGKVHFAKTCFAK